MSLLLFRFLFLNRRFTVNTRFVFYIRKYMDYEK